MAIDPSIYGILDTKSLQTGLPGAVDAYYSGQEQKNRLSQLAQAKEMQGLQMQQLKTQMAESDKAIKEKQYRDLHMGISGMLRGGATPEQTYEWGANEALKLGIPEQKIIQGLSPLVQGKTPGELANYYEETANPELAAKQRLEQRYSQKQLDEGTPVTVMKDGKPVSIMSKSGRVIGDSPKGASETPFSKINPSDYTPESVLNFSKTNDYSVLVPRVKPEDKAKKDQRVQDVEMKLADDYRTESKGWAETSTSMKKVLTAIDKAHENPGSALAAGTAFMKILDPNSVVRETELGMALNASGWFDRAGNTFSVLQEGRIMTKEQQKQLKNAALDLFEEAKKAQLEIDNAYAERAKNYGANPKNIITQRGQTLPDIRLEKTPKQTTPSIPKIGDVQDGYVFLGGNPADPTRWRPK